MYLSWIVSTLTPLVLYWSFKGRQRKGSSDELTMLSELV